MPLPVSGVIHDADSTATTIFLLEPNGVSSRPALQLQQGARVDTPSGAGFLDKDPSLPANRYTFEFACETRAERKALERFYDQQRGRELPFWFPTWERNARLVAPGTGTHMLYIANNGYDALYALGPGFRRWLLLYGDMWTTREVIEAPFVNDPSPGITRLHVAETGEILSGFTPPSPAVESLGVILTALRWGRFDDDAAVVTDWPNGGGLVTLPILELNDEARD